MQKPNLENTGAQLSLKLLSQDPPPPDRPEYYQDSRLARHEMSGLEIAGLIGAIPGVVALVTKSIALLHKCGSSKKFSSVGKGAHLQLLAIKDLLITLDARCKDPKKVHCLLGDVRNIKQVVKELGGELENLTNLLNSVGLACTKGEGRFVRRAQLLFSGYESQFKEQFQRIEAIKSLLTLILTNRINLTIEQAIEGPLERRREHLLKIKTILQPCKQDFIPSKLPGTLDWVPEHPDIATWMDPKWDSSLSERKVKGEDKSIKCLQHFYGV
ncbi:unnamed protein product [Clonostachys byssicola]|uniref:Fungal N-terminal domain-containing protein n=1 Tax=Clonostachys byssicola TaxID=160290 RepID=A0A9N9V1E3_9HYPO|nr:unnamed protein product [Clonostachys byssicola]